MLPERTTRVRRLFTVAGMTSLALALASPARAQEGTDLDLKPADFVPEEPIAIRVDNILPGKQGSDVAVTVLNRTKKDIMAIPYASSLPMNWAQPRRSRPIPAAPGSHPSTGTSIRNAIRSSASSTSSSASAASPCATRKRFSPSWASSTSHAPIWLR